MSVNNVEAEYMEIADSNAWSRVYQKIGRDCQLYPYTCLEAKKPQNKMLNRYRDVNPYDHTRIILKRSNRDYINANLVKMERANRQYILTQGPLVFTVSHFWLMVWEQNSRAILMLNKLVEKNEIKCHWYWPHGIGDQFKMVLTDVSLSVEQISEEDCGYFSTRVFRIKDLEGWETRDVVQFHYRTWPDFGVPSSPVAFLDFLKRVRSSGALDPDVGPPVVHCSAGIGRSGTFCLVDSCLVIIEKEGLDSVNIQSILMQMRRDRMGLIQTSDQLRFSYLAIIEGAKRLSPDWKESIYSEVCEEDSTTCEEEAPPPSPPPRGESLAIAPARPLPAIPTSASLGDFKYPSEGEDESSDETPPTSPTSPPWEFTTPVPSGATPPTPPPWEFTTPVSSDATPPTPPPWEFTTPASSADDEDEEILPARDSVQGSETLRRRRNRELSERVSAIRRKARDAERWHSFKRSLFKPITITFGVILAGIVIYTYVKH